jgi:hypothetical protein
MPMHFIKHILFSLLFVSLLNSSLIAKNNLFTVLVTDGNILFDEGNMVPKAKLKIGDTIGYGTIIISKKTCLSLIYKNGNIFELTEQGIYSTADLENKIKLKLPSPECERMAHSFFNKFHKEIRQENPWNQESFGCNFKSFKLKTFSNYYINSIFKDSSINIGWTKSSEKNISFNILIQSLFNDTIFFSTIKDTVFKIDSIFLQNIKESHFLVKITTYQAGKINTDDSYQIHFIILKTVEEQQYLNGLKKLNTELKSVYNSPTYYLLLAMFYSKNNLWENYRVALISFFKKTQIDYTNSYSNNEGREEYSRLYLALRDKRIF